MPRTALFLPLEPSSYDPLTGLYTQVDPHFGQGERFRVKDRLGNGTYGVAYSLTDEHNAQNDLVAKLPKSAVTKDPLDPNTPLQQAVAWKKKKAFRWARNEFEEECRSAEAILDPPYLRVIDPDRTPGQGYRDLTLDQTQHLEEAERIWRAQPGYEHMHPLLHYDDSVPMLLSRSADGSLHEFVHRQWKTAFCLYDGAQNDPPLWRDLLGRQLGAAVGFLLFSTPMAHLDIKLSNILYTQRAPGVFHIQLTDYGMCLPKDDPIGLFSENYNGHAILYGTQDVTPPADAEGWAIVDSIEEPQADTAESERVASHDYADDFDDIPLPDVSALGSHELEAFFDRTPETDVSRDYAIDFNATPDAMHEHAAFRRNSSLMTPHRTPSRTAARFQPRLGTPSNATLSLFQYYATALSCLYLKPPQQALWKNVNYDCNAQSNMYWVARSNTALNARMINVEGRSNRLFLNAMHGLLSEAPETELIDLFRQLHQDLAIECECP